MEESFDLCVCVGEDIPHADGDMACMAVRLLMLITNDWRLVLEDVTLHMWGSITVWVQRRARVAGRCIVIVNMC